MGRPSNVAPTRTTRSYRFDLCLSSVRGDFVNTLSALTYVEDILRMRFDVGASDGRVDVRSHHVVDRLQNLHKCV